MKLVQNIESEQEAQVRTERTHLKTHKKLEETTAKSSPQQWKDSDYFLNPGSGQIQILVVLEAKQDKDTERNNVQVFKVSMNPDKGEYFQPI